MSLPRRVIVVYDDACTTCSIAMRAATYFDAHRVIDPVGVTTERGKTLIAEKNLDMAASAYAIEEDGTVHKTHVMVSRVLSVMGAVGRALRVVWHTLPLNTRERLYARAARHRSHTTKSGAAKHNEE